MPQINFTQYMRPDGRKGPNPIIDPPEIAPAVWAAACNLAEAIEAAGYRFEVEHLGIGDMASLSVAGFHREFGEDNDIILKVCHNGPNIPQEVVNLVNGAAEILVAWGKLDG